MTITARHRVGMQAAAVLSNQCGLWLWAWAWHFAEPWTLWPIGVTGVQLLAASLAVTIYAWGCDVDGKFGP